MGNLVARVKTLFGGNKPVRIAVLGLDAAGKTTLTHRLSLGEIVTTVPTIGFTVQTVEYKNLTLTMWDVGGQDRLRPLWRHYYEALDSLIYVVDSADRERMAEAGAELGKLLKADELTGVPLLVYANKQDNPGALPPAEISNHLGLHGIRGRDWFIQPCTAISGEGLYEGLDWVSTQVNSKK